MEGSCLCGAIRVKLSTKDAFTNPQAFYCHCDHCRKVAGGLMGANILARKDDIKITGEQNLQRFEDKGTDSGIILSRFFCGTCGNPIMSTTKLFPEHTVIKLGIFPTVPKVTAECYTANHQPWLSPVEGATQFAAAIGSA